MATPSHHPFLDGMFHEINQPFLGTPIFRAGNPHMIGGFHSVKLRGYWKPMDHAILWNATFLEKKRHFVSGWWLGHPFEKY